MILVSRFVYSSTTVTVSRNHQLTKNRETHNQHKDKSIRGLSTHELGIFLLTY